MKHAALLLLLFAASAHADEPPSLGDDVLGHPSPFRIESIRTRYTHYDQSGLGYQSQAGPLLGAGSEQLTVEQAQIEIVAKQGDRLTHRLWIPLDVITAASPDAIDAYKGIDAMSTASRTNEAGNADLTSTYKVDRATDVSLRAGFHLEENFRSWNLGAGFSKHLADDNALLTASINQAYDWFDTFQINGDRVGHENRSTTNVNVAISQLLSPTTVAHLNYGGTLQIGELSNTWNSVPLTNGSRGQEFLPRLRQRHAFVGRLAQWLPWNGAMHVFYRFYVDDWGIVAHTVEAELYQRLGGLAYVRLNYRFHHQSGADFFTIMADPGSPLRTADSDLAPFDAHTIGAKIAFDLHFARRLRDASFDLGYERYIRTNNLRASIVSCGLGFRF